MVRADGDVHLLDVGAGAPKNPADPLGTLCLRGIVTGNNDNSCPNTVGFPLTQPLLGNFGSSARNSLRLDGLFNTNAAVWKDTKLMERLTMQFRWEFYNLFNHPNMSSYVNGLTSTSFNTYQGTATDMRQMQAAIKFIF